ncbi:YIP1 family protein [Celeribacter litoreus]|uniref:YIP1 family protein n=1 Tax=Celeribacter litoreus TaxID=2876714 RepID=UPI001CCED951|nr:YIP1 family protein [Celeribacter litoreus]MCA0043880.1 YIP1 family protein [Celeribacter litoreus]
MGVVLDMAQSYRAPRAVLRRRLGAENESSALVTLMLACGLIFVAQWPRLSRVAFETGQEVQMLMGATLLGWLFIMPLIFYVLAGVAGLVLRAIGRPTSGYEARMALFWGLLCAAPLWLLWGLTAGFVGPGAATSLVGVLALFALMFFWGVNLSEVARKEG